MAQQNEHNHYFEPASVPVKRKRGRPRKEDVLGTEPSGRTQQQRRNPPPTSCPGLAGRPVSGVLDGVFDAGFLITVRVDNNGPLLRGVVFDSRHSVPISAANDVAPHIKMSKREEFLIPAPIPAEQLRRRKVVVDHGSQGLDLKSKLSEAVILGAHSIVVAKGATPVAIQVPDNQRQELTDESIVGCMSQTPVVDNQTAGELKQGSTDQTPPANEIECGHKLDSTRQIPRVNETLKEPTLESASQILPESHDPAPVPELDSKSAEIQSDADQVKSGASAAGTQQTSSGGTV